MRCNKNLVAMLSSGVIAIAVNKSSCSDTASVQSTLSANKPKASFGTSFKYKTPELPKLNYALNQRYIPKQIGLNQSVSMQN